MKAHTAITWDERQGCWHVIATKGTKRWEGWSYGSRSEAQQMARRFVRNLDEGTEVKA